VEESVSCPAAVTAIVLKGLRRQPLSNSVTNRMCLRFCCQAFYVCVGVLMRRPESRSLKLKLIVLKESLPSVSVKQSCSSAHRPGCMPRAE